MRGYKAGDLRQIITLIRPDTTTGEHNRRTTVWTDVCQVYAKRQEVSGREFYAAHAVNAEDIVSFTIRYRTDVDSAWRIRQGTTTYNILEVNHLGEMRDYMTMKCRAIRAGGT